MVASPRTVTADDEPTSRLRRATIPHPPRAPSRDDAVPVALAEIRSSGPVSAPRTRTGEYCMVTKRDRAGSESEAPLMAPTCEILDVRDGMVKLRVSSTILNLKLEDARALAEMVWRAVQRATPR